MNTKPYLLALVLLVVIVAVGGLAFLVARKAEAPTSATPSPVSSPVPSSEPSSPADTGELITVSLAAQHNSGQSGLAILGEEDGRALVLLVVEGTPADVAQPTHIHRGACADLGEIYYPLNALENGTSDTEVSFTFDELRSELPLAVNVHKSESEIDVFVACGNIVPSE